MKALNDAGFFIGFGEGTAKAYQEGAVEAYFARNRTDNGVEGCKLGWDYVEHLNHFLPFGAVDDILATFDKHIVISRHDRVAQAVSRLVARQTGQWTSLDERLPVEPVYNRARIDYFIAQAAGDETAIMTYLSVRGIRPLRMAYEENNKFWALAVQNVFNFVEAGDIPNRTIMPTIQRQEDPIKKQWIERYLRGE